MVLQRIVSVVCVLFAVLAIPSTADAGMTFISQDRYIWASNSNGDSASASASGFEPFNAAVNVTYVPSQIPPGTEDQPNFVARANQNSFLGSNKITTEGIASSFSPFYRYEGLKDNAQSYFAVTFELDCPSYVLLSGMLGTCNDAGDPKFEVNVTLSDRAGGTIYALSNTSHDPDTWNPNLNNMGRLDQINDRISLDAGTYNFEIDAFVEGWYGGGGYDDDGNFIPDFGGGGAVHYDIKLAIVPAPAALSLIIPGLGMLGVLRRKRS